MNVRGIGRRDYLSTKVEIRESEIDGNGLFAVGAIGAGEVVFVKGGEKVDAKTIEERYQKKPDDVFWPCEDGDYLVSEEDIKYTVPLKTPANHSCEPNTRIEDDWRTAVALRDILTGEEITFDYRSLFSDARVDFECKCGSDNCARRIQGKSQ